MVIYRLTLPVICGYRGTTHRGRDLPALNTAKMALKLRLRLWMMTRAGRPHHLERPSNMVLFQKQSRLRCNHSGISIWVARGRQPNLPTTITANPSAEPWRLYLPVGDSKPHAMQKKYGKEKKHAGGLSKPSTYLSLESQQISPSRTSRNRFVTKTNKRTLTTLCHRRPFRSSPTRCHAARSRLVSTGRSIVHPRGRSTMLSATTQPAASSASSSHMEVSPTGVLTAPSPKLSTASHPPPGICINGRQGGGGGDSGIRIRIPTLPL